MNRQPTMATLAAWDDALETCVYCPKLCRAACPVSNAAASETLTPWGKMSLTYFSRRGDVPVDETHAAPVWACAACEACRHRCEHDNQVARVLLEARVAFVERQVAPVAARELIQSWPDRLEAVRRRLAELDAPADHRARTALLVGCAYVRYSPEVVGSLLGVLARLGLGPVRVARGCCGLPLRDAGDRSGFRRQAEALARELDGVEQVLVADPGCARTLIEDYPRLGIELGSVRLVLDEVAARLDRVPAGGLKGEQLRYQDPCQLARGLDCCDAPRAILTHLAGRPPAELVRSGAEAECCGAGGLLPLTHPEISRAIADGRIAEHRAAGGGRLVTACGSCLHQFRSRGADVVDLVSLVAAAWGDAGSDHDG